MIDKNVVALHKTTKHTIMKRVLIAAIAVLISTSFYAQEVDFGIKVGANFATLNDISTDAESRTGFVVGAFAGAKLGEKIGIQGDLLYSQQGAKFDVGEINLDYVNIPIVLKYYVTEKFNIQAGPQFGFVASDKLKGLGADAEDALETKGFDLTGVVGIGFDLPAGFRIDGRYNFGLSTVLESEEITDNGVQSADEGKNSVITLALGYSFL